MKLALVLVALALTGCATNGQTAGAIVGAVLLTGVLVSSAGEGNDNDPALTQCHVVVGPNGSQQVCN